MENFYENMLWYFIGVFTTLFFIKSIVARTVYKIMEQLASEIDDVDEEGIQLRIESSDGVYYIYYAEGGGFICQGKTLEELREGLKREFPNGERAYIDGDKEITNELSKMIAESKT